MNKLILVFTLSFFNSNLNAQSQRLEDYKLPYQNREIRNLLTYKLLRFERVFTNFF
jgi:hypothetical protein